jgi:phosphoglycolate phosphatase-like HAD superfamily hydrolase
VLTRRAVERAGELHGGALDARRCVVVGDTPLDVAAARAAGAVSVAVASGHFGVAELGAAGADHVLASLEEELPL